MSSENDPTQKITTDLDKMLEESAKPLHYLRILYVDPLNTEEGYTDIFSGDEVRDAAHEANISDDQLTVFTGPDAYREAIKTLRDPDVGGKPYNILVVSFEELLRINPVMDAFFRRLRSLESNELKDFRVILLEDSHAENESLDMVKKIVERFLRENGIALDIGFHLQERRWTSRSDLQGAFEEIRDLKE